MEDRTDARIRDGVGSGSLSRHGRRGGVSHRKSVGHGPFQALIADPLGTPDFTSRKTRTLPFSFDPPGKRVIWRVVKRPDLIVVEARLIYFQKRASLLHARHVLDREAECFGGRFETPVTKSAASACRFARIKPCSVCVIESDHVVVLRVWQVG